MLFPALLVLLSNHLWKLLLKTLQFPTLVYNFWTVFYNKNILLWFLSIVETSSYWFIFLHIFGAAKNFCPVIYPLDNGPWQLIQDVPLISLHSLQVKPSPKPPHLFSKTVIQCQPLMVCLCISKEIKVFSSQQNVHRFSCDLSRFIFRKKLV